MEKAGETPTIDVARIRADFPVLDVEVSEGVPLIYMDSGATSQKPNVVIDAMTDYYRKQNANIHRGVHTLAEISTEDYEGARAKVAKFIGGEKLEYVIRTACYGILRGMSNDSILAIKEKKQAVVRNFLLFKGPGKSI